MTSRERAEKLLNSKAWADVALLDPESDEPLLPLIAAAIDEAVAEEIESALSDVAMRCPACHGTGWEEWPCKHSTCPVCDYPRERLVALRARGRKP